jgi:glucan biosynthesis protein
VGEPNEDFVKLRKLYLQKINDRAFRLLGLVDGEAYAAAFAATLQPGAASSLRVSMKIYLRQPLRVTDEPSLGPLGLSSMFWKDETATPNDLRDEAHDADRLVAYYPDGRRREQALAIPADPAEPPLVLDFGEVADFALVQSDRNAAHYRRYASVDYANRASLLVSDIASSLSYAVALWQTYTDYEGADNVAVFVRFNQDAERPASASDGITFSYTLTAYR